MNDYELVYIITSRKAPDDIPTVIDWVNGQVTSAGGELLKVNNWGRRRLAYPINHLLEGTYILAHLRMPADAAVALEAALHITEDIVRHLLVRGIMDPEGKAPPEYVGERPRFAPRPTLAPAPAAVAEDEGAAAEDGEEPVPAAEPEPAGEPEAVTATDADDATPEEPADGEAEPAPTATSTSE